MQRHKKQFGPYAVLAQTGSGGMGTIYRAQDTRLGREVAVKVLHQNLDISGARERFVNEARVVSSLNHPNICTIFDIGEQGEDLFLVMEMLHGESLKERIARGPLPAEDIYAVGRQVARALAAAHARGIVHRDIKPANIFLSTGTYPEAQVKVLDFGLAKHNARERQYRTKGITRHGATVGTVEYMSPEQACGYETDERSDLFSLGAVMYEMATGVAPFRGATSAVIYSELLNKDPLPARDANLNVPAALDSVIQRLLQKAPEERFQTASELLHELDAICPVSSYVHTAVFYPLDRDHEGPSLAPSTHGLTPLSHVSSSSAMACRRPIRISRRRRSVRFALLCLLLGMLVATARSAWAGRSHPEPLQGTLMIMPLLNHTGNTELDSAPNELLAREWSGTRDFSVQATSEADANKRSRAGGPQSTAEIAGVLTGSIVSATNGYSIRLAITDPRRHIQIAEASDFAPSSEQVPAAITRAAAVLRENLKAGLR